ncbi:MAG: phenylalanine--tRNA ligase subunit alpha [Holosporales bacterium]|jgi:phenylalanyl-tRNA synthetase alpha chain|nr:phenylalanine--tRNA ligase subunit alpha [Holosporales bacterium]
MANSLDQQVQKALSDITACADLNTLEALRVSWLGRQGHITALAQTIGTLPAEQRKAFGADVNRAKKTLLQALENRQTLLTHIATEKRLKEEFIDCTLPPVPELMGCLHPLTRTQRDLETIFKSMGFRHMGGPNIENEFLNFTALNMPEQHPARQMHDTFFVDLPATPEGRFLLRTQTSPVQIRAMRTWGTPLRMFSIGSTYRSDSDATHTPMFHQVEALVIEEGIHFGHMKGCITEVCARFFGIDNLKLRLRPSFFPFTDPSAEVDIPCRKEKDRLVMGEGDQWLEILGCGMVHPKVLEYGGLDPRKHQGFAFAFGVDRLAMLKYSLPDLRSFFDGNRHWLEEYGFSPYEMEST